MAVFESDILYYYRFDQLREQRNKHLVFEEFVEDTINFMPTYKYNPGN